MFCGGKAACQLGPRLRREGRIRHQPQQSYQQPVAMHVRVPIEAAIECRRQFTGRSRIGIAVQGQADVVGILIMQALERQSREARRRRPDPARPRDYRKPPQCSSPTTQDPESISAQRSRLGACSGYLSAAARGAWPARCKGSSGQIVFGVASLQVLFHLVVAAVPKAHQIPGDLHGTAGRGQQLEQQGSLPPATVGVWLKPNSSCRRTDSVGISPSR